MSAEWKLMVALVAAYLIGGIPFGFIVGKMRGKDVRKLGSKNIGATNVYRTVGKKWGFLVFFCDFLKGLLPTLVAKECVALNLASAAMWIGLACVLGHTLTPYMKFKGGKGVATAFGMLVALMPLPVLAAFGVFVITVWLSHYISLGSCLAALFLAIETWFLPQPLALKVLVSLISLFVIIKHRANIARLRAGTENKIY